MKILVGADPNGYDLKANLIEYLVELGHDVVDMGAGPDENTLYPDVARDLALEIARGVTDRGILICGTGLGVAIAANKVPGVRAATCHDPYSAERVRKSNNAQIITFGAQIIAPTLARTLVDHWLASEYQGGRSAPKVDRMIEIDKEFNKPVESTDEF